MNDSDKDNIIKIYRQLSSKFREVIQTIGKENKDIDYEIFIVGCHKAIKNLFESCCITVIKQIPDKKSGLNHILAEIDNIKSNIQIEF